MKNFGVLLVIGLIGIALAMPVYADHDFRYGDANSDGQVNVGDAILVLRSIVGLETLVGPGWYAADVNGDDSVNVGDAIAILRWIVGLVDQFPAEAALNEALAAVELAESTQQQGDVDNARAAVGALPPIPPRDD
ncbi:MAG: dockerin type I repeat-containing protein, partial [Bacteroidales bacterium]